MRCCQWLSIGLRLYVYLSRLVDLVMFMKEEVQFTRDDGIRRKCNDGVYVLIMMMYVCDDIQ